MKITGETLKFKAPLEAGEVLKDHPGLVLLDSENVKHYGVRAKPLGAHQMLQPRRLYFLVELPKERGVPRRVRSGINMSAEDRLESLKLARRSTSDLSSMAKAPVEDGDSGGGGPPAAEGVRVRVRLSKAEVERLMRESRDGADAAEKIMRLYINKHDNVSDSKNGGGKYDDSVGKTEGTELSDDRNAGNSSMEEEQLQWEGSHRRGKEGLKKREVCMFPLAVRDIERFCYLMKFLNRAIT